MFEEFNSKFIPVYNSIAESFKTSDLDVTFVKFDISHNELDERAHKIPGIQFYEVNKKSTPKPYKGELNEYDVKEFIRKTLAK